MICVNCGCRDECEWLECYERIKWDIYNGIGVDNPVGYSLARALNNNDLKECDYFEKEE